MSTLNNGMLDLKGLIGSMKSKSSISLTHEQTEVFFATRPSWVGIKTYQQDREYCTDQLGIKHILPPSELYFMKGVEIIPAYSYYGIYNYIVREQQRRADLKHKRQMMKEEML